jgi:hypothetical protein
MQSKCRFIQVIYSPNKPSIIIQVVYIVGGRTSAKRNPTGTIPGNQAIEQEANAYINIKQ